MYLYGMQYMEDFKKAIEELCEKHHVRELYIFGSVTNETFRADSDIDLAVEFLPIPLRDYSDNYFNFKERLETLTGRSVDLIELRAIRNPVFKQIIQRDRKLIYGRAAA